MKANEQLRQARAAMRRRPIPFLFIGPIILLAIIIVFSMHSVELSPRHPVDEIWTEVIIACAGILCFALMFRVEPRTWKTNLSSAFWSLFVAFCYAPIAFGAVQKIHEQMDFVGASVQEGARNFPIDMAYVHYNKGNAHYRASLRDYPPSLVIDEQDYLQAFGKTERVWPDGFCVHVRVQWTPHALRTTEGARSPLPTGSLRRCPPVHHGPARGASTRSPGLEATRLIPKDS